MLDTYLVHSFYFQGKKPSYKKENNNKNIFYWWRPSKKCFHFFAFYIRLNDIQSFFCVFCWSIGEGVYLGRRERGIFDKSRFTYFTTKSNTGNFDLYLKCKVFNWTTYVSKKYMYFLLQFILNDEFYWTGFEMML